MMRIYRDSPSDENIIDKLAGWLENAQKIVFFGGAGVSTESGVPDFRSENGLYKAIEAYGYPPETILSHSFFTKYPDVFFKYYFEQILYPDALPNFAHTSLAALESSGMALTIITQNIDGLHQASSSKNVIELHGSVHRNYCTDCGEKYELSFILDSRGRVPKCLKCHHMVRPDVALYEEPLDSKVMTMASKAVDDADLLIVGGTSLVVYPAAGLVRNFKSGRMVLINKSETPLNGRADLVIKDNVSDVLNEVTKAYFKRRG